MTTKKQINAQINQLVGYEVIPAYEVFTSKELTKILALVKKSLAFKEHMEKLYEEIDFSEKFNNDSQLRFLCSAYDQLIWGLNNGYPFISHIDEVLPLAKNY